MKSEAKDSCKVLLNYSTSVQAFVEAHVSLLRFSSGIVNYSHFCCRLCRINYWVVRYVMLYYIVCITVDLFYYTLLELFLYDLIVFYDHIWICFHSFY